ncbi:hypothetical protein AY600_05220 [Phormidium willei BDU 130791]|nr:hypothetical protein AY600_05220 [Phormidium willei BDU 130791]
MTPEQQKLLKKATRSLEAARELNHKSFLILPPRVLITPCFILPLLFEKERDYLILNIQQLLLHLWRRDAEFCVRKS